MYDMSTAYWVAIAFSALALLYIASAVWQSFRACLGKMPGPLAARFTRLWIVNESRKGQSHILYRQLHQKYGKLVRIAPRKVSISDPAMIPIIFGGAGTGKMDKSHLYDCFTATLHGRPLDNIFSTIDPVYHKQQKNIFAPAYQFSALRQMEPLIDECTTMFVERMRDLAGKPVDFGTWVQWYAFDVIGAITFCKTFGFMEHQRDKHGIMPGIDAGLVYTTVIGQVPELHWYLFGNHYLIDLLMKIPAVARANPLAIVEKMTLDAMAQYDLEKGSKKLRGDYLEFLRKAQEKDPGILTERDLMSGLFTNLLAGSDTTAMSIRAIFYYLIKNPRAYKKLRDELDDADRAGDLSPIIEHKQAIELPYLQAVIKEAMRLHSGISHPLERVVPECGADLCDTFIPAGTIVGISSWVVHHDKSVYGQDADAFRPERWLEADKEVLKIMERTFFPFGYGSRTCIGKNVAILQMSKFVPQVVRQFDLEWASDKDWSIDGYWFAKQTGFIARLMPRTRPAQEKNAA